MKDHFSNNSSPFVVLIALVMILVAVFSYTFVADKATSLEHHAPTIASIDEKKDTVMKLTASTTLASTIVSAIPGDTATPIAEELADLPQYFLIVLCVLYAEKYLLTILGFITFKLMIPAACILFIVCMIVRQIGWKQLALRLGIKLFVCGILLYVAIPISIQISDMIEMTYKFSIENTIAAAEQISEEAEEIGNENESLWTVITDAASSITDSASKLLNRFVEALAVMIVTTCLIPILVLFFFIWLIRTFTGLDIPYPKLFKRHHRSDPDVLDDDMDDDSDDDLCESDEPKKPSAHINSKK